MAKRKGLRPGPALIGLAAVLLGLTTVGVPIATGYFSQSYGWVRCGVLLVDTAAVTLIFGGLGYAAKNRLLGILLDERNVYSLSRLQMTLWTLLVLSTLSAVITARSYGLSIPVHTSVSAALDITIPGELFALMGISYFTGVAAPSLLALKAQTDNTPDQVQFAAQRFRGNLVAIGQVAAREAFQPPVLSDFVMGDDLSGAGAIDLSKVQQLLISLLLVATYFAMVAGMLLDPAGFIDTTSKLVPKVFATVLPKPNESFVALLAISHGGYLAYKAMRRVPNTSAATSVDRPASPDPSATTS